MKQKGVFTNRWLYWIFLVSIFILAESTKVSAVDSYIVEGRNKEWSISVNTGWIGGNYYEIEEASYAAKLSNPKTVKILNILKSMAQEVDVVLFYFINPVKLQAGTFVKSKILEGYIPYEVFQKGGGDVLKILLQKRKKDAANIQLIRVESNLSNDGYPAYRGVFKVTNSSGIKTYETVHIVFRKDIQRLHMFWLSMDVYAPDERFLEFNQMLSSLKYSRN